MGAEWDKFLGETTVAAVAAPTVILARAWHGRGTTQAHPVDGPWTPGHFTSVSLLYRGPLLISVWARAGRGTGPDDAALRREPLQPCGRGCTRGRGGPPPREAGVDDVPLQRGLHETNGTEYGIRDAPMAPRPREESMRNWSPAWGAAAWAAESESRVIGQKPGSRAAAMHEAMLNGG